MLKKSEIHTIYRLSFDLGGDMKKILITIIYISLILFVFQCKTNDDVNLIDLQETEEAVGLVAKTVTSLIGSVYLGSQSLSIEDGTFANYLAKDIEFVTNYNDATGWWKITFSYDGYQVELEIQLQDGSGNPHKDFNSNISNVLAKGNGSGTDFTFSFDWTITGVHPSAPAYLVNGTGTVGYNEETVSFTLENTEIQKQNLSNPASGSLTVEAEGITFNLVYDGSAIITVSYSYNGQDHRIVINIHTGAITRLS